MKRSCRGQGQMARFVYSGMVLKAKANREEEEKYLVEGGH